LTIRIGGGIKIISQKRLIGLLNKYIIDDGCLKILNTLISRSIIKITFKMYRRLPYKSEYLLSKLITNIYLNQVDKFLYTLQQTITTTGINYTRLDLLSGYTYTLLKKNYKVNSLKPSLKKKVQLGYINKLWLQTIRYHGEILIGFNISKQAMVIVYNHIKNYLKCNLLLDLRDSEWACTQYNSVQFIYYALQIIPGIKKTKNIKRATLENFLLSKYSVSKKLKNQREFIYNSSYRDTPNQVQYNKIYSNDYKPPYKHKLKIKDIKGITHRNKVNYSKAPNYSQLNMSTYANSRAAKLSLNYINVNSNLIINVPIKWLKKLFRDWSILKPTTSKPTYCSPLIKYHTSIIITIFSKKA